MMTRAMLAGFIGCLVFWWMVWINHIPGMAVTAAATLYAVLWFGDHDRDRRE